MVCVLRLCFSFDVVLHPELFAVEDGIGEEGNPVAEDEHPAVVCEHEVELDVSVAEDEIVDVGMRAEIFLGVADQVFALLAHVGWVSSVAVLAAAVLCPSQSELHTPSGMQGREKYLRYTVMEQGSEEAELGVRVSESVAVCEVEDLVGEFEGEGLPVHDEAAFPLEVVVGPDVVVACEEMHLHSEVGELAEFAEEACVSLRHDVLVLVPEVEHVAEEVYGSGLFLDGVEEAHEPPLLCARMLDGSAA